MADIFGRKTTIPKKPITADMCTIVWGGKAVASATNITLVYQQQIIRRRTLGGNGNPVAVIHPTQPFGSISIQRLICETTEDIFSLPGWNICRGAADLNISFNGATAYEGCTTTGGYYLVTGAMVTGYSLSAEAEGLTVADNVQIEFLQLNAGTVAAVA